MSQAVAQTVETSIQEQNSRLVHLLIDEGFNKGNLSVVDEIIGPEYVERQFVGPEHPKGAAGVKHMISELRRLMPDIYLSIEDEVVKDDEVWVRLTARGTHEGEFFGLVNSGKKVVVDVMDICRFQNGKMVEHWGIPDRFHLMLQLGMIPAPMPQRR